MVRYVRSWITTEEPTRQYLQRQLEVTQEQIKSLGLNYARLRLTIKASTIEHSFWQVLFQCRQQWIVKVTAEELPIEACDEELANGKGKP